MSSSTRILTPENPNPNEDWTVVLPRRGKKSRNSQKFVIPKREKEVQLWAPTDLETDPERESKLMQKMQICIQKLENSEFCHSFLNQMQTPEMLDRFLKVLGSEKKMQMVIYGIGSIESFEPPRLQLSLALLIKRKFEFIGEIEVFDPIISLTESKVLTSLGCSVLSVNEQGRRQTVKPTLFFMPHCELELYENLLEANWEINRLNSVVVFGNSFSAYEQHLSVCNNSSLVYSRRHILAVRSFAEEFGVSISSSDDSFRAFHGSSWHFLSPDGTQNLSQTDKLRWIITSSNKPGRWIKFKKSAHTSDDTVSKTARDISTIHAAQASKAQINCKITESQQTSDITQAH